jgi:SAM-dependent methyltransferase
MSRDPAPDAFELPRGFVAGNTYDKYRARNPLHRALVRRFLADARELIEMARPRRVLEVGCGPGDLAGCLFPPVHRGDRPGYVGVDVSPEEIAVARRNQPHLDFRVATAYALPFQAGTFDLVIACEVLEHLEDPARALVELDRIAGGYLLASVPWEPVWRLLNLARGAYVTHLGNTPGHLQHFSRRRFRELVHGRFEPVAERRPLPWTLLLARSRRDGSRTRERAAR